MKTVLLTTRINENSAHKEVEAVLDTSWTAFFTRLNCLVIPILTHNNIDELFKLAKPCGVILTGGNDLSSINNTLANSKRDQIDQATLDLAIKLAVPVIGVCRGMQFIASKFGFKIYESKTPHVVEQHEISWQSNISLVKHSSLPLSVNSYHKYCIGGSNPEFQILATANDGSIEAFMHKRLDCLGIMWHPERSIKNLEFDTELFTSFLKL